MRVLLLSDQMLQVGPCHGIIGADLEGRLEMVPGLVVLPPDSQQDTQVAVCVAESRVKSYRLAKGDFGLVGLAQPNQEAAQVEVRHGQVGCGLDRSGASW